MARVYIGIGSNIDKHLHIPQVVHELQSEFDRVTVSPIYRTPAVGFDGEDFFNLVVGLDTSLQPVEVFHYLRALESEHGRKRTGGNQFIARTLDLDQLLYDDRQIEQDGLSIPHADIIRYPFVLKPLVDIAPQLMHPVLHKTMQTIWDEFDQSSVVMQQLDLANIVPVDSSETF